MKTEIKYFVYVFLLGCGAVMYIQMKVDAVEQTHERKYFTKEMGNEIIKRLDKIDSKLDKIVK